eukprot:900581_1
MSLLLALFIIIEFCQCAMPPTYGPYGNNSCTVEQIYIGGYVTGGSQYAYLVYPTEALTKKTILPFLTFAHGMELGGNSTAKGVYSSYRELLQSVCSYGYIIVAPQSCLTAKCAETFYIDVETTITTVKSKGASLSPALSIANFSSIGLFGHSLGAISTLDVVGTKATELGLIAGVPLHGDSNDSISETIEIPLLFFTGSNDSLIDPYFVQQSYLNDGLLPKVFAEIDGAGHMEPASIDGGQNREDSYVAVWFDCFLKDNATACNQYFFDANSKDNICSG